MFRDIDYTVLPGPEVNQRTTDFQQYVARNPTVASYIRHLTLSLPQLDRDATEIPHRSMLVNLQSLTLRCSNSIICSVNDEVLNRVLSFVRHTTKLERLSLQSVIIDPSALDVFIACISIRAPGLQNLHVQSIWGPDWVNADAWSKRRTVQRPFKQQHKLVSLTRLCVSDCEFVVVPAFLRAFDLQRLERLALLALDYDALNTMVASTMQCAHLTHLTVELSDRRGKSLPELHWFTLPHYSHQGICFTKNT